MSFKKKNVFPISSLKVIMYYLRLRKYFYASKFQRQRFTNNSINLQLPHAKLKNVCHEESRTLWQERVNKYC